MKFVFLLFVAFDLRHALGNSNFWTVREQLLDEEESQWVGADLILSSEEKLVNEILMDMKYKEYDKSLVNNSIYLSAIHIIRGREAIEQSEVFKFLQKLPKGADLHIHDVAFASGDFIFNLTYRDNLYICFVGDTFVFRFLESANSSSTCEWQLLSDVRKINSTIDQVIASKLTLYTAETENILSEDDFWKHFIPVYTKVAGIIQYRPVFEDLIYRGLKELYDDNIIYVESRISEFNIYELNGSVYTRMETLGIYENIIKKFKRDYPDFIGAKLIFTAHRTLDNATIAKKLNLAIELKNAYPDLVIGFDLALQEKNGHPIKSFYDVLVKAKDQIDFFFHTGITGFYGSDVDENVIDAILLNTRRIGHGLAVPKHKKALELIKERGIAVEVLTITCQYEAFVTDVRNHPAVTLLNQNYPVVIGNEMPAFIGTKGVSYDWYMAFMGLANRKADLRMLKQLALNSLKYAAFTSETERVLAYHVHEKQWNNFINEILEENGLSYVVDKNYTESGCKNFQTFVEWLEFIGISKNWKFHYNLSKI